MRILFLISSLGSGGAERVAVTLCNAWASRGDKVTLIPTFLGGGVSFYETDDNVEVIYLADIVGSKRKSILSYTQRIFALRRLIIDRKPDVVVSFLPNVNVAAIVSSAFLKVPLIICERSDPSARTYSTFWKVSCRLTYRFADILTVQTGSVANKISTVYSGLRKVRVIPNPLPRNATLLRSRPIKERKILLSMGRLSIEKQVDHVIRAFSNIGAQFSNWDLHIYGDGPLMPELDNKIQKLQLQERIFLKGLTADPWAAMAGADVFVMTSKYEGFPNALLEAMGVGLPCVVYDCQSGPREITRGGIDAMLVPLNNEGALINVLEKIMGDEALRDSLGIQARKSVLQRFQLSAVLDRWDELFREVGVNV